ncbi:Hypothetical predicted protein [Olea europaea subsp. europaea]|uniref:Uncharacterized protein n=1 Tax=Olea europaea subsp. europaea TaxID=158383 RepID=A0A8S0S3M6_OLEEU|nr:Hypothetical predicted protein [Olea europaea subsp. europaea]
MSQQPRPAWARLPFMARAAPAAPIAQPTTTPAPPPTQTPRPRAPFGQLGRTPSAVAQISQSREPTPPPPPAAPPTAPPAAAPPSPARSPRRSPVTPPVPAPSTPRRSPISAPPTVVPSPKPSAPSPPRETTISSTTKSPIINTKSNSPIPKEPLPTSTNVRVPSSPIRESPKTKTQSPSSSMQASPVPKPVVTAAPESSPKTVKAMEKTPVQSPKPKPVAPPPSPFTLPPSQLKLDSKRESEIPTKVDQKDVLVQETIEKFPKLMQSNSHNSSIAPNGKKESPKAKVPNKKTSDSEKLGMSMITLAGDNKGAVMELSPSRNKNYSITNPQSLHKNGNLAKPEGEKSSSHEEGRSNKEKNKKAMAMQSPPTTAYVNSNVQGVNNSIFFNSSSTHQNPGVHLSINRKANEGNGIHFKDHKA